MISGVEVGNPTAEFSVEQDGNRTVFTAVQESQTGAGEQDAQEFELLCGVATFFRRNPTAAEYLRSEGYDATELGTYSTSSQQLQNHITITYPSIPAPSENFEGNLSLFPFQGTAFSASLASRLLSYGRVPIAQGTQESPDTVGRYDIHDGTRHQGAWELVLGKVPGFGEAVRVKAAALIQQHEALPPFPDTHAGYWTAEDQELVREHDTVMSNFKFLMDQIDGNLNLANGSLMTTMKELPLDALPSEREQTRLRLTLTLRTFFMHQTLPGRVARREMLREDPEVTTGMVHYWAKHLLELAM